MKRAVEKYNISTYLWAMIGLLLLSVGSAHAASNWVRVYSHSIATQYTAYAQIEPIAVLPLRAQQAGLIMGMHIMSGESLKAGQIIGRLGGPEIKALLLQDKVQLKSAKAQLVASRKSLSFQKQQRKLQLTTKLAVFQAESALAQAEATLKSDQAKLNALRHMIALRASVDGRVLMVDATNGERMSVGQPILTIQPKHGLWLKAVYYGTDASMIRAGMSGRFIPADGSHPVQVRVNTVFSMLGPDGGEGVGLVAMKSSSPWRNGEFGKLTLNGPMQSLVSVPTQALILDQGKWWVMMHTIEGDQPQAVVPGPTRGWQTFIVHGLKPGAEVVVDNAYLEFHRSIAQHYQLPD